MHLFIFPVTWHNLDNLLFIAMFLQVVDNVSSYESRNSSTGLTRSHSMSGQLVTDTTSVFDFKLIKVLGKGRCEIWFQFNFLFYLPQSVSFSFGKVFLVRPVNAYKHEVYAMKVLSKKEVVKRHQVEHTKTERWILQNVQVRQVTQFW
jgi:hypothetical protein